MAIHSSTIAWKIPWTEEPSRLQSMGSQRVGHNWVTSLTYLLTLSKGFLPTVVDIIKFELNLPIPVYFGSLIPKMSMFTLAISCLTTSNLPWFMDLAFHVPMQYCSLQHQTLLLPPVTSTAGYCFCFGSIPSFFLELFLLWLLVAYWAPMSWGVPLSVSYHFAFSYCSWGSQGKNTEVACHSLLQWTTFCQTSPPWPAPLG